VIAGPVVDEPLGIGFVVIAESHISVHVQGDRAFVDCFSCRRFNWGAVVGAARRTFGGTWSVRYFARSVSPKPTSWFRRCLRGLVSWWCGDSH
jgi:S-adenosylmethionine/arginine decarboxylase-like enzyme